VVALEALRAEIAHGAIQPLVGTTPDAAFWNRAAAAYRGRTWLELPWFFAETYFYRRLLEVVGYFAPGPWQGHDPFAPQKRQQEQEAVAWLNQHWPQLDAPAQEDFEILLHSSLWGNRADLSNLTVREEVRGGLQARQERHNLLIDDTGRIAARLSAGVERLAFVADNAGRELLLDLVLADWLLGHGWAGMIILYLKGQPFFVSDAMPRDVEALLARLGNGPLGRRLAGHLAAGRLALAVDPFWTRCLTFRQMPEHLATELARAGLVILKGDVNYRRLLDDAHWPPTARVEQVAAYFPAPFVTLRTLKGEIIAGLQPGQAEALAARDPEWLINGKRGIIQYVNREKVDRGE
jgi:hypothetical protein